MQLHIDTTKKTAAMVVGTDAHASFPLGPGPGAENAHFDAMMAELQPVLDKWLPNVGNNNT